MPEEITIFREFDYYFCNSSKLNEYIIKKIEENSKLNNILYEKIKLDQEYSIEKIKEYHILDELEKLNEEIKSEIKIKSSFNFKIPLVTFLIFNIKKTQTNKFFIIKKEIKNQLKKNDDFESADYSEIKEVNEINVINNIYEALKNHYILFGSTEKFDISKINKLHKLYRKKKLENYLDTKVLQDYWKIFLDINSLRKVDTEIKVIDSNRELFRSKILLYIKIKNNLYKIKKIPSSNNNLYINHFFSGCLADNLKDKSIDTINDLKGLDAYNILSLIDTKKDYNYLIKVLKNFEVSLVDKLYNDFLEFVDKLDEREKIILKYRSYGFTLQEIGDDLKITRERVRQIENKMQRKYRNHESKLGNKNLYKSYQNNYFLTYDELETIYKKYTKLVIHLTGMKYDSDAKILELTDMKYINKKLKEYITSNEIYSIEDLNNIAKKVTNHVLKIENKQINQNNLVDYLQMKLVQTGPYYSKNRLNLMDEYYLIVKEYFSKVGVGEDNIDQFRKIYYQTFNDASIFDRNSRAIFSRMKDHPKIITEDKKRYNILKKADEIPIYLLDNVYKFIIENKAVYMRYLYDLYKDDLNDYIKNHHQLHDVLKKRYDDLYFTREVVGVDINPSVNVKKMIDDYINSKKDLITIQEIEKNIPQTRYTNLEILLYENPEYILIKPKTYLKSNMIIKNEEEILRIKEVLEEELNKYKGLSSNQIARIFERHGRNMSYDNDIYTETGKYNIMQFLFRSDYIFVKNGVYLKVQFIDKINPEEIIMNEIIKEISKHQCLSVNDVRKIAENKYFKIKNVKEFLDVLYKNNFIRIDDDNVCQKSLLINENTINRYKKELDLIISSFKLGYLDNLEKLNYDELFGGKANKHFVAHLIKNIYPEIKVETIGNAYNNLEYKMRWKNGKN